MPISVSEQIYERTKNWNSVQSYVYSGMTFLRNEIGWESSGESSSNGT